MSLSDRVILLARRVLPGPMTIAILLTVLTIVLALLFTQSPSEKLKVLGGDDQVLAEISLIHPSTVGFSLGDYKDSLFIGVENGNELVLRAKRKEVFFRQIIELKPEKSALETVVKLDKNRAVKLQQSSTGEPYFLRILGYWEGGFFNFLAFAMQMMLILVLGHVLALTKPVAWLIGRLVYFCNSSAKAAFVVTMATMMVALFNWGLGLIFGAILARKVGEAAAKRGKAFNYPLIGAAGYSGLMVWHGGLSGSAPLKIAEANHELVDKMGVIPISETIFSPMNLTCSALLLLIVPSAMFLLGKMMSKHSSIAILDSPIADNADLLLEKPIGAEKLDYARWFAWALGLIFLFIGIYKTILKPVYIDGAAFDWTFRFVNPNYIIFMLFGLAILLQGSLFKFNKSVDDAIVGSAGIMIQFPFYAGIMGIMMYSGLVEVMSGAFESISNQTTFPLFTFFSASLINMFVPSGGGQWLVQGPIVIEGAQALGVSLEKSIMALCYGDQATNMLQPFWALPLLGITRLKAQEILPYSFFLFVIGTIIFSVVLLIF